MAQECDTEKMSHLTYNDQLLGLRECSDTIWTTWHVLCLTNDENQG